MTAITIPFAERLPANSASSIQGDYDTPALPSATVDDRTWAGREHESAPAVTIRYIVPGSLKDHFEEHFLKLKDLANNSSLWPRGADQPLSGAMGQAHGILEILRSSSVLPTRIVASGEGGIAICFIHGDNYADIECLNSGEILGITSNRHDRPVAWEIRPSVNGVVEGVYRIQRFLASRRA